MKINQTFYLYHVDMEGYVRNVQKILYLNPINVIYVEKYFIILIRISNKF